MSIEMADIKRVPTPEMMWDLYLKYKSWAELNPLQIQDYVGGGGREVMRLKPRAISQEGFWCWGRDNGLCLRNYFKNQQGNYDDFKEVVEDIKTDIRVHQIEGGMAGIYNPAITQRLNGLAEKTENKNENSGDYNITFNID